MEFRTLRRIKQIATPQECEAVLSAGQRGILAVHGENGYPFLLPIRAALAIDLADIMAVLEAAKGIMRASGNTEQWTGGYPSEEVILHDIERGHGQVVVADGRIAGYFAFIPSPEPTYATIYDGTWLDDSRPYHVVHRIGSYPEIHGVFRAIMDWCFERDGNIRIDTHRDNHIMQHNILKYGFRYCGIIYLASGDERLAYQKMNG